MFAPTIGRWLCAEARREAGLADMTLGWGVVGSLNAAFPRGKAWGCVQLALGVDWRANDVRPYDRAVAVCGGS